MKKRILNSLTTAFILSLVVFMSCGGGGGGEPEPTPNADRLAALSDVWTATSTTVDSSPNGDWDGFTLTIGGSAAGGDVVSGTYQAGGTRPDGTEDVWQNGQGTWDFTSGGNVTSITRNDDVVVSAILSANDETLTLSFTIPDTGGRTDIVAGNWVQVFSRQ